MRLALLVLLVAVAAMGAAPAASAEMRVGGGFCSASLAPDCTYVCVGIPLDRPDQCRVVTLPV